MVLGPVKPHVKEAADEITQTFGITNIGGFASSGHIPGSYHYKGQALDVMIAPRQYPAMGDKVAAWAKANAAKYNVVEVIWNHKYWNVNGGEKSTREAGVANSHTTHVHISFGPTGGTGKTGGVVQTGLEDIGCLTQSVLLGTMAVLIGKRLKG